MTHPYEEALREALTAIGRVRAIHVREDYGTMCAECSRGEMAFVSWPCPTLRTLDGD